VELFVCLKLKVKSERLWKDPSAAPQDDNITPVILKERSDRRIFQDPSLTLRMTLLYIDDIIIY